MSVAVASTRAPVASIYVAVASASVAVASKRVAVVSICVAVASKRVAVMSLSIAVASSWGVPCDCCATLTQACLVSAVQLLQPAERGGSEHMCVCCGREHARCPCGEGCRREAHQASQETVVALSTTGSHGGQAVPHLRPALPRKLRPRWLTAGQMVLPKEGLPLGSTCPGVIDPGLNMWMCWVHGCCPTAVSDEPAESY
eukprot:1147912-Pelagomonas_calceolata.AAC.15